MNLRSKPWEGYLRCLSQKYPSRIFEVWHSALSKADVFEISSRNSPYHMKYYFPDKDVEYRFNSVQHFIECTLIPKFDLEEVTVMPPKNETLFKLPANFVKLELTSGCSFPKIKKVIFSDPATIVIWEDGDKTVVKVKEGEMFDPWTGIAMCHMKKLYGSKFHGNFKKWVKQYEDQLEDYYSDNVNVLLDTFKKNDGG